MIPYWFWIWAEWNLGRGAFKGHARDPKFRPKEIPKYIHPLLWAEFRRRFIRPNKSPEPTIWDSPGVIIWHSDALGDWWIPSMQEAGFKWAAFLINDGMDYQYQSKVIQSGWLDKLREAGISPIAWSVLRTNPKNEAFWTGGLIKQWGFEGFIANAEAEYELGKSGSQGWYRTDIYLDAFRQQFSDLPCALCTYGLATWEDMKWKAWQKAGFHYLPEVYADSDNWKMFTIPTALELAKRVGWLPHQIHPTVGIYNNYRIKVNTQEWRRQILASGVSGFNVYLGELMNPDDFRLLTF